MGKRNFNNFSSNFSHRRRRKNSYHSKAKLNDRKIIKKTRKRRKSCSENHEFQSQRNLITNRRNNIRARLREQFRERRYDHVDDVLFHEAYGRFIASPSEYSKFFTSVVCAFAFFIASYIILYGLYIVIFNFPVKEVIHVLSFFGGCVVVITVSLFLLLNVVELVVYFSTVTAMFRKAFYFVTSIYYGWFPTFDVESQTECAICMEDFRNDDSDNSEEIDPIKTLRCGHRFHCDCIDPWIAQKSSCPLCRASVF